MTQHELLVQEAAWLKSHSDEIMHDLEDDPFTRGYIIGHFLSECPALRFLVSTVVENAEVRSN